MLKSMQSLKFKIMQMKYSEATMNISNSSAKEIKNKDIATALSLPSIKIHCSVLAEDSIRRAIEDFESKL